MSTTYEIGALPLEQRTHDASGREIGRSTQIWYSFPDEVCRALVPILPRYGYSGGDDDPAGVGDFLRTLKRDLARPPERRVWALVFYPDDYPLAGHFVSVRESVDDMRCSGYEVMHRAHRFDPNLGLAPRLSQLWIFSKPALARAAHASPLFAALQGAIGDLDAEATWVHFADPPDPEWVAAQASADDALFYRHWRKEAAQGPGRHRQG